MNQIMREPEIEVSEKRRHAVIAGTGRAGTTFLVDFLRRVGVPTSGLSSEPEFARARAGLERSLLEADDSYLIKDPWFYEYADSVNLNEVTIDALIIPIRNLTDAAISRVRLERAHMFEHDLHRLSETVGRVPGGIVYSLNVTDQERVLAVGQARLINWALQNQIPLLLISYPRLVNDAKYLVETLWPWLQQFSTRDTAREIAEDMFESRSWGSEQISSDELFSRDSYMALMADKEAFQLLLSERSIELEALKQNIEELQYLLIERGNQIGEVEKLHYEDKTSLEKLNQELCVSQQMIYQINLSSEALRSQIEAFNRSRAYRIGKFLTAPSKFLRRQAKRLGG